ncbi:DUF1428 domain-containing protein [Pleomorphomonas sp. PLEO]|uniref:DUF1428 domain-containing protein n=1 Tax=Pleomorphomonas sp. PLEO TaxID=3239306 RepID=UPI00351F7C95
MSYFDCYLIPVPETKLETYRHFSKKIASVYRDYGAVRVIDCVLDPDAQFHADEARAEIDAAALRDFRAAAATSPGEVVVLSWTEWPSKTVRDECLPHVLSDPRIQPEDGEDAIFEGKRLVAGGFFKVMEV